MENNNNDSNNNNEDERRHLPEDLITQQILPWVPIKPLTQYKLVSELWYSSISSPDFILDHYKKSLFTHSSLPPIETLFIQAGDSYYLYSCDYNDDGEVSTNIESSLVMLHVDFNIKCDQVTLVGCRNGLVCLGEMYGRYFILWNPTTNKFHTFYAFDHRTLIFLHEHYVCWGFGYVSSLDDYKIIRIIFYSNEVVSMVHVFSLKSKRWDKIEFGVEECFLLGRARLVNETLYWTMMSKVDEFLKIVAFNLVDETFDIFPHLSMNSKDDILCVIGGCLAICGTNSQNDLIISIFKSPGRVASVRILNNLRLSVYDDLIGFTKTGKFFVAHSKPTILGLVDLSSSKGLVRFPTYGNLLIEGYVPSQVSPLP